MAEFREHSFPVNDVIIMGSLGPHLLKILERAPHDVDLLVQPELFDKLAQQYKARHIALNGYEGRVLQIGNVEITKEWPSRHSPNEVFGQSTVIDGVRIMSLSQNIEAKEDFHREKDGPDLIHMKKAIAPGLINIQTNKTRVDTAPSSAEIITLKSIFDRQKQKYKSNKTSHILTRKRHISSLFQPEAIYPYRGYQ